MIIFLLQALLIFIAGITFEYFIFSRIRNIYCFNKKNESKTPWLEKGWTYHIDQVFLLKSGRFIKITKIEYSGDWYWIRFIDNLGYNESINKDIFPSTIIRESTLEEFEYKTEVNKILREQKTLNLDI